MPLSCKTKINAPNMYEVPDKDMMKIEIMPFRLWQTWLSLKTQTRREYFQYILYKLNASFQGHIMRKSTVHFSMFLMFLCQHGRIYVKTRKMNVFVKPNEQCRACPNIGVARKRTFRETRKVRLTRSLVHLSSCQPVRLLVRQPL